MGQGRQTLPYSAHFLAASRYARAADALHSSSRQASHCRQQEPSRPTMWVNRDSLQAGLQKGAALALNRSSRGSQAAEQESQQDGACCCHLQSR